MHIRQMTITDYDEIYALFLSCKGMGLNDLDDSREGIERFLKRNPDTCFVAENMGRVVGCIMVGNDGRRGYIYHTAVHPDCRKQGIGAALVEVGMAALKANGITRQLLWCLTGTKPAMSSGRKWASPHGRIWCIETGRSRRW